MAIPVASISQNLQYSSFNNTGPIGSYNKQTVYVFQDGNHADLWRFLSPLTPAERHRTVLDGLIEGTGEWLFQCAQFCDWKDGRPQVLCCIGPPGVGKTSIASRVIDRLQNSGRDDAVPVLFLYCDYQDKRQTTSHVIGVLLAQLVAWLTTDDPLVQELRKLHRIQQLLSIREGEEYLNEIIGSSDFEQIYICLDALDELGLLHRREVLQICLRLANSHPSLKLFLTARDNAGVDAAITQLISRGSLHVLSVVFPLTVEAYTSDVRVFLNEKIDNDRFHGAMNDKLRQDIITKLSGSTFLMASLRIAMVLEKQTIRRRKESLEDQLLTLDIAYARTVERVKCQGEDAAHFGMEVIRWVLFAEWPLTLKELRYAVAITIGSTEFDPEEELPAASVVDLTLGLVTIDHQLDVPQARFFHSTFKEYLEKYSKDIFPAGHSHLALVSLTYLSLDAMESSDAVQRYAYGGDLHPFAQYASFNWGHHAQREPTEALVNLACCFLQSYKFSAGLTNVRRHQMSKTDQARMLTRPHSPLHEAVYFGAVDLLQMLLVTNSFALNSLDLSNMTPLSWAVELGQTRTVQVLLEQNSIDINIADYRGRTPLSLASQYGRTDIVQLLLQHRNVNANAHDSSQRTPLSYAAAFGRYDIVQLLLQRREVAAGAVDRSGLSPLSYAIAHKHKDVVALLLSISDFETASVDKELFLAAQHGEADIIEILLACNHVRPDHLDSQGRTPLSYAAESGAADAVELLLTWNVVAHLVDKTGWTPLFYAVKSGEKSVVELLLARDDVVADLPDTERRTPLSHAAGSGKTGIVELLLARTDVAADSRDGQGRTPLSYAVESGEKDTVNLFLCRNDVLVDSLDKSNRTPLSYAAAFGHKSIVELLLARDDVKPDSSNTEGRTPLSHAAGSGRKEIVELLLAKADIRAYSLDIGGRTPFSHAAESGSTDTVSLFLYRNDVVIDSADDLGRTPFSYAASSGHQDVVELLLSRGDAKPDFPDIKGCTPLSYAAEAGRYDIVKLLLERSDVVADSTDSEGHTALCYASENGNKSVVGLLLQANGLSQAQSCQRVLVSMIKYGWTDIVEPFLQRVALDDTAFASGSPQAHYEQIEEYHQPLDAEFLRQQLEKNRTVANTYGLHPLTDHSPLWYAADYGEKEIIMLLLQRSQVSDHSLCEAIIRAKRWEGSEIVELLEKFHASRRT